MIDGETKILGVLGDPVSHSLSPAIQNAALAHFKMNYRYFAFPVARENLRKMVEMVRILSMPGVNVTIPYKGRIVPCLDEVSPLAKRLGAVNTVVRRGGKLAGWNTDCAGFRHLFRRIRRGKTRSALLFGAGGAARAVLAVLMEERFAEVVVVARRVASARKMIGDLGAGEIARALPWDRREASRADLLVNATPLGLRARDPMPASARIVRHARGVIDLVVRPRGTRWVALARSYGIPAEEGSAMLIAQGCESFHLWFGKRPPFPVMQKALWESTGVKD